MRAFSVIALGLFVFLTDCGGGGGNTTTNLPPPSMM